MRITWALAGCVAAFVWLLIFSAGLLIDSCEYRHTLAPSAVSCKSANQQSDRGISNAADISAGTPQTVQTAAVEGAMHDNTSESWPTFMKAMLLYTPLNLAILSLFSAFIGGCASLASYGGSRISESDRQNESEPTTAATTANRQIDRAREFFLTEIPLASALRGFLVYLAIIGGLYAALGNPFPNGGTDPQVGAISYARLAGIVSFLSFVVGYDPTRISAFMDLIPGRPKKNG